MLMLSEGSESRNHIEQIMAEPKSSSALKGSTSSGYAGIRSTKLFTAPRCMQGCGSDYFGFNYPVSRPTSHLEKHFQLTKVTN